MKNNPSCFPFFAFFLALCALCLAGCGKSLETGSQDAKGLSDTKKIGIEVNGTVNGMFITMTDANKLVLLFISGGPGVPEVWLNEAYADEYPNRIADYFTVCYWDYYGEGLSYSSDIDPEDITIERLARDARNALGYERHLFQADGVRLLHFQRENQLLARKIASWKKPFTLSKTPRIRLCGKKTSV